MEKEKLAEILMDMVPGLAIDSSKAIIEIKTDPSLWHVLASNLRNGADLQFDYLYNLYSVDRETRFTVTAYLESTTLGHSVIIRTDIPNHDHPSLDTVSDIWITAQYQEREIYDLMGIIFNHHPDLRRLFLEDGWGFPLRKDYKDDINLIER